MFFENEGKISSFRIQKLNLLPAAIYKGNTGACSSGRWNKIPDRSLETQGIIKYNRQSKCLSKYKHTLIV